MATSQARPRFLTAPLLAAKRVDVCPHLDCVVVLHGVHVHPLVGAHQALTRPLAAGISTSLLATPCTQGTQCIGLGSHGGPQVGCPVLMALPLQVFNMRVWWLQGFR